MTDRGSVPSQPVDQARRFRFETGPVIFGLGLIVLGVLFLLDQAGAVDAGTLVRDWWPVLIIALGLGQLLEHPRSPVGPLIVAGVGLVLLLSQLDLLPSNAWNYLWPALLVLVGLAIIFRWPGLRTPSSVGDDSVQSAALFGSNEVIVDSQRFRGGSAAATFGEVVIDLRRANLDPGGARLQVTALFGSVEVLVPRGWRVEATGTPIFGGFSNKTEASSAPEAPRLKVEVLAIFGGAEVKHDK